LFNRRRTQFASHQVYRRVIEGSKRNTHPNVLPITDVSKSLSPFCIMSPWTPDGNITQYIQMNPGANRLMLVRAHRSGDWWGYPTDYTRNLAQVCDGLAYLHGLGILHGAIIPVGNAKDQVNLHADA